MSAEAHADKLLSILQELQASSPKSKPTLLASLPENKDLPVRVTRKNVFRHPEAHPLVLDLLLLQQYQEHWLGWEIETIEHRIPKDFGVDRISDLNMAKVQAVRTLHLVDTFWHRWEVFVWCAMPLNATFPDFNVMQVPTVSQCAIAVDIANRVRDDVTWSEELEHYLEVVHLHDGVLVPQAPLSFVRVDAEHYPVDVENVKDRWPSVRESGKDPQEQTPEDEQLRRMLHVRQELHLHQAQLRQQLELLHD